MLHQKTKEKKKQEQHDMKNKGKVYNKKELVEIKHKKEV